MKVLLLGPSHPGVEQQLRASGDSYQRHEDPLDPELEPLQEAEFVVSYGYTHIIKPWVIERFPARIINLHISLLPWNRGADPNLWSFLDNTPKGVTIHQVDRGVDTGPILFQQEVTMAEDDTLRSSYERLSQAVEALFEEHWAGMRTGEARPRTQATEGTLHRRRDLESVAHLLTDGWDTPVRQLIGWTTRSQEPPIPEGPEKRSGTR